MIRIVLWEFRKIVEHKWLWGLIVVCVVLAFSYEGAKSYHYEYGKRFDDWELYQYSIEVEKKYPGALNQYANEISEDYQELSKEYDTLMSDCGTELRFCNNDTYVEFISSDDMYYLMIYRELNHALKIAENRNLTEDTQYNLAKKSLAFSVDDDTPLKNKFIALKLERISDLQKSEASVYINHEYILNQYIDGVIFYSFLILVVLGVGLVPVYAHDYDYQTNYLIGSSKAGRTLVLNKILAGLIFGIVVFISFFSLHLVRFLLNNQMQHVLSHPIYAVNNSDLIPWRDITFVEFIVYYWGYIFLLMMISVFIFLLISRVTKKVFFGVIISIIYFTYPFIIDNMLKVDIEFRYRYLINYLNVSKVYAHSERLLFLGDPYEITVYDHRFWGRDVILLNAISLILLLGYLSYRYIRRIDLT